VSARTEFGVRLKQAREARGLSLREIAATTKISTSALEGLEHGDASRLPGGIFSRAFVRAYASECHLDPESTVREFLELFPSDTNPVINPVVPAVDVGDSPARRRVGVAVASVVLVAAAVTAFFLMGWVPDTPWFSAETPARQDSAAAPVLPPPPASPTLAVADPAAPVPAVSAVVPEPVGTTDGAPPAAAIHDVAQVSQDEMLRLLVQPTARCWVHIVADGAVVFAREMTAGEREVREARGSFVLTVGNAAAFAYAINDVPGRSLGGEGKVVKVRIDRASLSEFLTD
jgi:transcriptional regulator with XRE-family HTH domain